MRLKKQRTTAVATNRSFHDWKYHPISPRCRLRWLTAIPFALPVQTRPFQTLGTPYTTKRKSRWIVHHKHPVVCFFPTQDVLQKLKILGKQESTVQRCVMQIELEILIDFGGQTWKIHRWSRIFIQAESGPHVQFTFGFLKNWECVKDSMVALSELKVGPSHWKIWTHLDCGYVKNALTLLSSLGKKGWSSDFCSYLVLAGPPNKEVQHHSASQNRNTLLRIGSLQVVTLGPITT